MTNKEILEKAIQKAIDGGWHVPFSKGWLERALEVTDFNQPYYERAHYSDFPLEAVIFNHDFAKALWGEVHEPDYSEFEYHEEYKVYDGNRYYMTINDQRVWDSRCTGWQYHLQQMVISEDPIKYLEENI